MHQRNDLAAEVPEVGNKVVEVHLDAVTVTKKVQLRMFNTVD